MRAFCFGEDAIMDQEILRSLFHNILSIDELDGYLVPRRYTPSQRAFFDTI